MSWCLLEKLNKSAKIKSQKIKLVCFDLDNTLIDFHPYSSGWDFLHEKIGVYGKASELKNDFFNGKMHYKDWANADVELWKEKKVSKKMLEKHVLKARPIKNALKTLKALKAKGLRLALVSGSIDFVLEAHFPKELFDHIVIEKAFFSEDGLLERIDCKCCHDKKEWVERIAKTEGLKMSQVAFVGDGFNDIEAVKAVGLGIAFNPSDQKLKKHADFVVEKKDLSKILEYL